MTAVLERVGEQAALRLVVKGEVAGDLGQRGGARDGELPAVKERGLAAVHEREAIVAKNAGGVVGGVEADAQQMSPGREGGIGGELLVEAGELRRQRAGNNRGRGSGCR
jgi:hypothetical protein